MRWAGSPTALALGLTLLLVGFSGCTGGIASDWAYRMVGLRTAQASLSGAGIKVAIIDTGIDAGHPALKHAKITWRDEVNHRREPYDDVGHGSHVAGILVGKGGNFGARMQGFNLQGAATGVELVVVKAIDAEGSGTSTAVAAGIQFSVQQSSDIICLSLGAKAGTLDFATNDINRAVDDAVARGVLVVASAGNTGQDSQSDDVASPAVIVDVIAVGAVGEDKKVADFSARSSDQRNDGFLGVTAREHPNKKPEIVAPGVNIKSSWKDGGYATAKGTSQSAPFVCGALALLLEECPQLKASNNRDMVQRVKGFLMETAEKIPGQRSPHDNAAGYGLLRADQLVEDGC